MTQRETTSNPQQSLDLLRVCRIGKAQGLRGEVNVQSFTDEPYERFAPGVTLLDSTGARAFHIAHARTFKQRWIIQFEGIEDRTQAESLLGTELYIEADPPELLEEQNAWYPKDLIGLDVLMASENQLNLPEGLCVGKVSQVLDGAAQSLLVIKLASNLQANLDALVPFLEHFVPEVHITQGFLTIDPPPGLIESLG